MGLIYTTHYTIPFYDSDAGTRMTVPALLNVALQASGNQSTLLGRSDDWLRDRYGLSWIVIGYEVSVSRLPVFKEEVIIETEASTYNKFFCYRDFVYKDLQGHELVVIHSTWSLMDIKNRRATRIVEEVVNPYQAVKSEKIEKNHRFHDPVGNRIQESSFKVKYSDIDMNQHVNNTKYLSWAIDTLGYEYLLHHVPEHIFVKYNQEVAPDDQVLVAASLQGTMSYHNISGKSCQIEINWREVEENDQTKI